MSRKPVYVMDATPIIHFARIHRLSLILSACEAYITREVHVETVLRQEQRRDAIVIRDATDRGELRAYDVRDRELVRALQRHPEIHLGEAETLAAAREMNAVAIVDEAEARAIARTYGVATRTGTLFLLFRLLSLKRIDRSECERTLEELVESGLYIDSQTLMRAKRRIREPEHSANSSLG